MSIVQLTTCRPMGQREPTRTFSFFENQPEECSHCGTETTALRNYSRHYGGNVGGHWLCVFCETTVSASRLGAGGQKDQTVADIAAMLNVLARLDEP